jgi:hypothetical protein
MPTLKELLEEWYESTSSRLPRPRERFNSIPPSPLSEEIWGFVREWLVQHPPAPGEVPAGSFDAEGKLHLEQSGFAHEVRLVQLSLRCDEARWQPLAEVRVTDGVARYARQRDELDLRDLAVGQASVRWEVVA